MKKKKLTAMLATAALAGVVALAGCSSGSSDGAAQQAAEGGSSAGAAAVAVETSADTSAAASASASEATSAEATAAAVALAPGMYTAEFNTDSSMFHANETQDGKGVLMVDDNGQMTIHVSLVSKRIVNLYLGTAAEAEADESNWLQPTTDEMLYDDGYTKEVYGFDIAVPAIGEQFDVALLGEKGKWYDHKVSIDNPEPLEG